MRDYKRLYMEAEEVATLAHQYEYTPEDGLILWEVLENLLKNGSFPK